MAREIEPWWRACSICGALPTVARCGLCAHCAHRVREWFVRPVDLCGLAQELVDCRVGFAWAPGESLAKARLLSNLKGEGAPAWGWLAKNFISKHELRISARRWLILPIPPHGLAMRRDHAWCWSMALARQTGGHVLPIMRRSGPEQQKHSRPAERATLVLSVPEPWRVWLKGKARAGWGVAVGDDVITTGATARAAQAALQGVPGVEIWALAHRTTLRNGGEIGYNAAGNRGPGAV